MAIYRFYTDIGDNEKSMKPSHNSQTIQPTEMADPILDSLSQIMDRGIKTKFVTLQIIDIMVHMIENSSHNLLLTICLNLLSKMLLGQLKTSTDKPYFKILLISSFNVSVVNITLTECNYPSEIRQVNS